MSHRHNKENFFNTANTYFIIMKIMTEFARTMKALDIPQEKIDKCIRITYDKLDQTISDLAARELRPGK